MTATLTLDDDVYQQAAAIAKEEQVSLGTVISQLARTSLGRDVRVIFEGGQPAYLQAPEGTPPISAETVKRVLEEESSI